jgi:hypothetical protein
MRFPISLLLTFLCPFILLGQTVSPEVVAAAGDYYESANASLSWTLGEVATETYTGTSATLTQGFQQAFSVQISGIDLDILVFLDGPYEGTEMNTSLNTAGVLPLSQPYNAAPWNYTGSETVAAIPNANVVDWVLVELRDANSASTATPGTIIAQKAAFILKDGSVVGMDGFSTLQFPSSISNQLYVVVWHRNHLGILSANAVSQSGGVFTYDFSTNATQVYNGAAGFKNLGGVWGMAGGDANGDGEINNLDKNMWSAEAGLKGYRYVDYNMDTQVDNKDKNDVMNPNDPLSTQVPQ